MAAITRGSRSAFYLGALVLSLSALAGCKGGGGGSGSGAPANSATASDAPTISGTAATVAPPNTTYKFQPAASDPNGDTLSFEIQNKPAWATFNTVTGELTGTPSRAHEGTYGDIIIIASDGKASARLGPFAITVGGARGVGPAPAITLAWAAPTQKLDGTPINDLAGYVIAYGTSRDALSNSVALDNPSVDRYVFVDLPPGTYYFALRAVSRSGVESALSDPVSAVIG